jgi:hypothetical protein
MGRSVLNRYERASDGTVVVDVSASRVADLYNDFDKNAPYIRRDLDPDLVDYLISCGRELGTEPFCLRFSLVHPPDEAGMARIRRSVNGYFLYLADSERRKIVQMLHRSAALFCVGLGILFVSVSVNQVLQSSVSVPRHMVAEGLTVAAWVSLWESLAVFLMGWFPHRRNIQIYRRLAQAPVSFLRSDGEGQPTPAT